MINLIVVLAALLLPFAAPVQAAPDPASTTSRACASGKEPIDEQRFVVIGGIEQWVTVKGDRCDNPIVLFLHGGPGNPLSPYAAALYGAWTGQFTLAHWDQRGAGKTYGRSPPGPDDVLTLERMRDDGVELAAHLARRYGQDKVILWGSSWGSILGAHMAKAHPERFHAYLGTSQLVSYRENQKASYAKVLEVVRAADDEAALAVLEAVGAPPWTDPRSFGKVRRVIRQYEAKVTTPPPASWWKPDPAYTTPDAAAAYEAGEEYSFLAFVGLRGDGMFSQLDLPRLGTTFEIPMFFVHGAQDLLSTPDVARRYFDTLEAPQKSFVLLDDAGHDPNQAIVDAQYQLLIQRIRPLTR